MQDELRPEYDLTQMRVRKLGPKRSKFGNFAQLAPDVEKVFPDSESVNEALRFLIRVTRQDQKHEQHKYIGSGRLGSDRADCISLLLKRPG